MREDKREKALEVSLLDTTLSQLGSDGAKGLSFFFLHNILFANSHRILIVFAAGKDRAASEDVEC